MRNKIIATIFILFIFVSGIILLVKESPDIINIAQEAKYPNISSGIDNYVSTHIPSKYNFINVNGLFQKIIGKTYIEDNEVDVYKMKNGMLTYNVDKLDSDAITWMADNVSLFKDELGKTPLLFVQLPYKLKNGDNMLPNGCIEYGNSNANALLRTIKNQGVDTVDLRTDITKLSSDYYSLFYKTDQHWRTKVALWAASEIGSTLKKNYHLKYNTSLLNKSQFKTEKFNQYFLGSFGKKTGSWYAGLDDFDLITPKYNTDLEFYAESQNGTIKRSGSFEESLLDKSNLNKDLFNTNTYETYIGGNYAITNIKNNNVPKGAKILLIRDSFSTSMMPFLSLGCSSITSLDLRYIDDKTTALKVAKSGKFDVVIIAYNPTVFGEKAFSFN